MTEIRHLPLASVELRDKKAAGIAAPFNSDSHDLGGFVEKIAPGAFARSLKAASDGKLNIYGLWAHDTSVPLASTRSGKLILAEDENGLAFEMDLSRMSEAQRSALEDGDLQCSFGFSVREQEWKEHDDGSITRTLLDVDLFEISLVISPAYPDTTVAMRSLTEWRAANPKETLEEVAKEGLSDMAGELARLHIRAMKQMLKARGKL